MKTAAQPVSMWSDGAARRTAVSAAAGLAVIAAGALVAGPDGPLPAVQLRAPDWSIIAGEALIVQLHLGTAVAALAIGGVLMAGLKGRTLHRVLGWTWVVCMAVTAISSLFIHRTNPGGFSFIHGLSAWTIVALPMAVWFARKHQVRRHRGMMMGLFFGGLCIAGLLAFLPGRVLFDTFFG